MITNIIMKNITNFISLLIYCFIDNKMLLNFLIIINYSK